MPTDLGRWHSPGAAARSYRLATQRNEALRAAVEVESSATPDYRALFRQVEQRLQLPARSRAEFRPSPSPSGRFVDRFRDVAGPFTPRTATLTPRATILPSRPPIPGESQVGTPQGPEFPSSDILEGAPGLYRNFEKRFIQPSQALITQALRARQTGLPAPTGVGRARITQPSPEQTGERPFVNPLRAGLGNDEEIQRSEEVLAELGLGRIAVQGLLDPLNALPIVGFTKFDDLARGIRAINRLSGPARVKALTAFKESETFQQALRGLREAPEAGARPLGGAAEEGAEALGKLPSEGGAVPPGRPIEPPVAALPLEPPRDWEDAASRIAQRFPIARKTFKVTELARRAELSRRTGRFFGEFNRLKAEGVDTGEAWSQAQRSFGGELPDVKFAESLWVTPEEMAALTNRAADYMQETGHVFEGRDALDAIAGMTARRVPRSHEIKAMRRVFGEELTRTVERASRDKSFWSHLMDVWMLPKAVRSSFDISFPARQGIMVAPRHPLMWSNSLKTAVKGWVKPQDIVDDFLRMKGDSSPVGVLMPDGSTQVLRRGQVKDSMGILAETVEPFYHTGLAERLPLLGIFVKRSQVSFTGAGNKLRSDMADYWLDKWAKMGVDITPERTEKLGNLLNALTGRATIGRGRLFDLMQATWWSPQYRLSGPQVLGTLAKNVPGLPGADAQIARIAAENLVAFVGGGVGVLSALKASGLADVEIDPRSTDFGKVQIGPTRVNFWGTSQLLARTIAQSITSTRIDAQLGPKAIDPGEIWLRYAQSGLSPEVSVIFDYLKGETYLGEPLRTSEERGIGLGEIAAREAQERTLPLSWLDIKQAIEEDAVRGGLLGTLGLTGLGVQSYTPSPAQELQNIPEFTGGLTQRQIDDVEEFLQQVADQRDKWRLNYGRDDISTEDAIEYLGEQTSKSANFIAWAERLRFGSSERDRLRNPEWIDYVVEHADEIREERPDLLGRNYIIDALREKETAGVR